MKLKLLIFLLVIVSALSGFLVWRNRQMMGETSSIHISQFFKESVYVAEAIEKFKNSQKIDLDEVYGGVAPHHIPTGITVLAEFYSKLKKSRDVDTFIILGPDHFEKGLSDVSISKAKFVTPFGELAPDLDIINKLEETGMVVNDEAPFDDHSIHSHLLFIARLFPEAKIVPIVFRSSSTNDFAEILGSKIASLAGEKTFIAASVDFSHYLDQSQARLLDDRSAAILSVLEPKIAGLVEADSPQAIVALTSAVKAMGGNTNETLGTFNSADFSEVKDYTTGYVVQYFGKKKQEYSKARDGTMIFTGDIMLSRSVGELMAKKGDYSLPFSKIGDFLKGADLTFGNLENPVSTRGTNVGSKYSFRADPRALEGLKFAGFDIVSIANNHLWDYGREAFLDTMTHLRGAGIDFIGSGNNFEEAHRPVIKDINGTKVSFLAYTEFLQSAAAGDNSPGITLWDLEQMKKDISAAQKESDLTVISFHWGDEYQVNHNIRQEKFAKAAIDAGADLIIGHHPHVVQEVEQYKDGWIAYSLGNFVFDQDFSKETKRGLVLKVEISDGKIISISKQPIMISNTFQPELIKE